MSHDNSINAILFVTSRLAIPFLILSFFIHYLVQFLQKVKKAVRYVNITAGILLIVMGLLLLTNKLTLLMFTG